MTTQRKIACAATLACALLTVGGCGGGSDTPASADNSAVPDSAGANPTAFIAYLKDLVGKTADNAEPAVLKDGFSAPTDNAAEPVALSG